MPRQLLVVCVAAFELLGCRATAPRQDSERQLKDSFVQQIVSTGIVHDLQRDGDTISFSARHADQADAKWRVHIDTAAIARQPDGRSPDKGNVKSSWYVNGTAILPRGDQSDLPLPFLDAGLAQECWAFWDPKSGQWSWK